MFITFLLYTHKDPNIISSKLGNVLEKCSDWLTENKLSLHLGKTECMLFWVPGRGQISQPYFVIFEVFWSNHCTMKNMNNQNNTELKLLRVFFSTWDQDILHFYI
jgi:hypothetical protein